MLSPHSLAISDITVVFFHISFNDFISRSLSSAKNKATSLHISLLIPSKLLYNLSIMNYVISRNRLVDPYILDEYHLTLLFDFVDCC